VLGHLGLAVNRLIRVSFGPFQLGEIAEGAVEEVRTRTLREQLGERVAAAAGADFSGPRVEREQVSPQRTEHSSKPAKHSKPIKGRARRDEEGKRPLRPHKARRRDSDRIGEPERARREKRRGWRPPRGKHKS
jgi:23S rRNA pseudouridine2605 synthase